MEYDDDDHIEDIHSKLEFLNNIIQKSSSVSSPCSKNGESASSRIKKRKTSSVMRKKPVVKNPKPTDSYDTDDKIREKVRFIVGKIYESRRYLRDDRDVNPDKMFRWVMEFLFERGYWSTDEIKDKFIVSLYAVFIGLRLKEIYLDPHLLSLEFQVPFKTFQKCIFECTPSITCETEIEKRIITLSVNLDRFSIHREYSNILVEFVPQTDDEGLRTFESRCRTLFDILSEKGVCDDEKQFCVTTDKIFIYGLFETLKKAFPEKTERMICDQLSGRFSIPRVTIEKMKRLINKTLRKVSVQ